MAVRSSGFGMFSGYPDIVSVSDVCNMLNLGRISVYRLLQENKIRHIRVGRKYIIPKNSVADFVTAPCYNESEAAE